VATAGHRPPISDVRRSFNQFTDQLQALTTGITATDRTDLDEQLYQVNRRISITRTTIKDFKAGFPPPSGSDRFSLSDHEDTLQDLQAEQVNVISFLEVREESVANGRCLVEQLVQGTVSLTPADLRLLSLSIWKRLLLRNARKYCSYYQWIFPIWHARSWIPNSRRPKLMVLLLRGSVLYAN
jgi:hypothetical protein